MEWLARQAVQAQAKADRLPSPCIAVCTMQLADGLCRGCLRTLAEIADWPTMNDADKRLVWSRIETRACAQGVTQGAAKP
jgi:predicted Fe-S protein YdhL (DUF1289 family)